MTRSPGTKAPSRSPKSSLGLWEFGFRKGADLDRRAALLLLLLLLLVWLLGMVYLMLVSRTVVEARHIQDLRDQLTSLRQDNAAIEQKIAQMQAVEGLLQTARGMGLTPASRLEFVNR